MAGYDLSRLMTGSFGSLAVIVSVTFKLVPVAPASRTVVVELDAIEEMAPIVADLLGSPLTPSAFELEWPPARLLIRFESVESAVEQQARAASELVHGRRAPKSVATTVGPDETEVWALHADRWDESGTLLKVSMLTDAVVPTLSWLSTACQACDVRMSAQGSCGSRRGRRQTRRRGRAAGEVDRGAQRSVLRRRRDRRRSTGDVRHPRGHRPVGPDR